MSKSLDDWAACAMQGAVVDMSQDEMIDGYFEPLASWCFDLAEAMQAESRKRAGYQTQQSTIETESVE